MSSERYLVYQPAHGLGVEALLLPTAFRLARLLDRKLVLPRIPNLETLEYRRCLGELFVVPHRHEWVSTELLRERTGGVIDKVYRVVPRYRSEYRSPQLRAMHPVWLSVVDELAALSGLGYIINETVVASLDSALSDIVACRTFASEKRVIAISYINGLLESIQLDDRLAGHAWRDVPTRPSSLYFRTARRFMPTPAYRAIHLRRGQHFEEVVCLLTGRRRQSSWHVLSEASDSSDPVVIISDLSRRDVELEVGHRRFMLFQHPDPQVRSMVDLALAIRSQHFVGNASSTFALYAAFVRSRARRSARSPTSLR